MRTSPEESPFEEAIASYFERVDAGEFVDESDLVARYPGFANELRRFLANQQQLDEKLRELSCELRIKNRLTIRCPHCHQSTEIAADSTLSNLTCSSCGSRFHVVDPSQAKTETPATVRMGQFTLLERLGLGSFGSVWKAKDDLLDRFVAIKIPRHDAMGAEEQEKFFREARAAAQLRHPNIVSVHEVGRDGHSIYIVSEFVQGVTLADFIGGQQLTTGEVAELCAKIGDALDHAHEQGVIHRDLKPGNIMIDSAGEPHIMDFGLARREIGEVTVTMDGQVLGTPAYMSPEQASGGGHAADRRSDVYSLGVILFQLLTKEVPFRGNARMLMLQVIHDEPPSPRNLNGNVGRDLETITLTCLEKSPERRYSTAKDMANELRRVLRGEPIKARPIGRAERVIRWVRRNRSVSTAAAIATLALFSGTVISTYFAFAASRDAKLAIAREDDALKAKQQEEVARNDAEARQRESEAVIQFLVGAIKSANPINGGKNVTVAEVLSHAEKDLEKLSDQPLTQAALLQALGSSQLGLGSWSDAYRVLERATAIRKEHLGPEDLETVKSIDALANAARKMARFKESIPLHESALAIRNRELGLANWDTLGSMVELAEDYRTTGRLKEAIELLEKAFAEEQKLTGSEDGGSSWTMQLLSSAYSDSGQFDKAIALQERSLARVKKINSSRVLILGSMAALASKYYSARRYDDAIKLYQETITGQKEVLGIDHPDTLNSMGMLASSYRKSGRVNDATPIIEEVVSRRRKTAGIHDYATQLAITALAITYLDAGRSDKVRALYDDLVESYPKDPLALLFIAQTLAKSKVDSIRNGKRAVELATTACDITNYRAAGALETLAEVCAATGDFDAAIKWDEKAIEVGDKDDHAGHASALAMIAKYKAEKEKQSLKVVDPAEPDRGKAKQNGGDKPAQATEVQSPLAKP